MLKPRYYPSFDDLLEKPPEQGELVSPSISGEMKQRFIGIDSGGIIYLCEAGNKKKYEAACKAFNEGEFDKAWRLARPSGKATILLAKIGMAC